jgi:hypothetical protein
VSVVPFARKLRRHPDRAGELGHPVSQIKPCVDPSTTGRPPSSGYDRPVSREPARPSYHPIVMLRGPHVPLAVAALAAVLTACAPQTDQPANPTISRAAAAPSNTGIPTTNAVPAPSSVAPSTGAPPSSPGAVAGRTGIRGVTVMNSGCPVDRGDPPCAARPVAATLTVLDPRGRALTTVASGTDGHFTVTLPPGSYLLRPVRIRTTPARHPTSMPVTVHPGRYITVTVRLDAGLRRPASPV